MDGEQLAYFQNRKIQNLRVFSIKNGKPSIIPFQIDQHDSNGTWVWDVVQNNGATYDDEDTDNIPIFDHNDQLLFMTLDLGEKNSSSILSAIKSNDILEIKVKSSDSAKSLRWVYIADFSGETAPPKLSSRRYMTYHPEQMRIESPVYQISYSHEYNAVMNQLSISGKEIIDRLKVRGEVEVGFLFLSGNMKFNEEEV